MLAGADGSGSSIFRGLLLTSSLIVHIVSSDCLSTGDTVWCFRAVSCLSICCSRLFVWPLRLECSKLYSSDSWSLNVSRIIFIMVDKIHRKTDLLPATLQWNWLSSTSDWCIQGGHTNLSSRGKTVSHITRQRIVCPKSYPSLFKQLRVPCQIFQKFVSRQNVAEKVPAG